MIICTYLFIFHLTNFDSVKQYKIKRKVVIMLNYAMKTQAGSEGIAPLFCSSALDGLVGQLHDKAPLPPEKSSTVFVAEEAG
jgi:hypothetical protein